MRRQRQRDESSVSDLESEQTRQLSDPVHQLEFTDRDEARRRVLALADRDEGEIADIETSKAYDFAQSLRSDLRSHLD